MKWKVWISLGLTRFAIEFFGTYDEVCNAANVLAEKVGGHFDYDISELK